MARIRTIKPEFWEDEKIGKLPMQCRLLFIGCWNFADDFGVIKGNASLLKSQIFPYDENLRTSEISKWLNALVEARMLIPIIHEEESYYVIRTFRSHQVLDKRYSKTYIEKNIEIELINNALGEHDVNTTCSRRVHDVFTTEEKEKEINNPPFNSPLLISISDWRQSLVENREANYENEQLRRTLGIGHDFEKLESLLDEYCNLQHGAGNIENTQKEYRRHFFNWARIKLKSKPNDTPKQPSEPAYYRNNF